MLLYQSPNVQRLSQNSFQTSEGGKSTGVVQEVQEGTRCIYKT
jgi:hypothetical protein